MSESGFVALPKKDGEGEAPSVALALCCPPAMTPSGGYVYAKGEKGWMQVVYALASSHGTRQTWNVISTGAAFCQQCGSALDEKTTSVPWVWGRFEPLDNQLRAMAAKGEL